AKQYPGYFRLVATRGRWANASSTAATNKPRMVKTVSELLRTPRAGSMKKAAINGKGAARIIADARRWIRRFGSAYESPRFATAISNRKRKRERNTSRGASLRWGTSAT